MGGDYIEKDAHRGVGDAAQLEFVVTDQANGLAEGSIDLGYQGQAQGVHIREMPVKAGWHDAGCFRHFAQADAAKAPATFHELAGGIEQGLASL